MRALGDACGACVVTKDMGLRKSEFVQILPALLDGFEWHRSEDEVTALCGGRQLHVAFGPEAERRIASVTLPRLPVTLTFHGFSEDQKKAFLTHFDRRFQRGGG